MAVSGDDTTSGQAAHSRPVVATAAAIVVGPCDVVV